MLAFALIKERSRQRTPGSYISIHSTGSRWESQHNSGRHVTLTLTSLIIAPHRGRYVFVALSHLIEADMSLLVGCLRLSFRVSTQDRNG